MWQKKDKKTVYTFNIDNYLPEVTKYTYYFMKLWADKIGADFKIITERKFPDMPYVYEKLQMYELAQKDSNDWNICVDSDALIHPETIDFTLFLKKDTCAQNGADKASIRWRADRFHKRDGRDISTCNWFTIFSDWNIEMVKPSDDLTLEEMKQNIFPTVDEKNFSMGLDHFVDDYTISRNVAKYGLKYVTLQQLLIDRGMPNANFFWHQYLITPEEKARQLKQTIVNWNLNIYLPDELKCIGEAIYQNDIQGWMSVKELDWLLQTAKSMSSIIEIGSWKGRSTHALLTGCKGTVTAVDTFLGTPNEEAHKGVTNLYEDFMKNVGHFPHLKVIKSDSIEASKQTESADMIFIDGDHSYEAVKADIEVWLPKCKKIICGHDIQYGGVIKAVTEKFGLVKTIDTIWYKILE